MPEFDEVPDPVPENGEVLVKFVTTSVNPIDYKIRSGVVRSYGEAQGTFEQGGLKTP